MNRTPWAKEPPRLVQVRLLGPHEAQEEVERALHDDPLNLLIRLAAESHWCGTDRSVEAEAKMYKAVELDENFWIPYLWLGADRVTRGLLSEARTFAEKAYTLMPSNWGTAGLLAGIFQRMGEAVSSKQLIEQLGDGSAFGAPFGLICYHLAQGEVDLAMDGSRS